MSRFTTIALVFTAVVFVSYLTIGCDAHRIPTADLEVAASDKHEQWEKGDESDYHESEHGEHGKKGEDGYDEKHGYVAFVNLNGSVIQKMFIMIKVNKKSFQVEWIRFCGLHISCK